MKTNVTFLIFASYLPLVYLPTNPTLPLIECLLRSEYELIAYHLFNFILLLSLLTCHSHVSNLNLQGQWIGKSLL